MVLAIGYLQLETLQLQSGTQGDSGTMTAAFLLIVGHDFHFVGTTQVVAGGQVELFAQQNVNTEHQWLMNL